MKITPKGADNTDLAKLVQNDKKVAGTKVEKDKEVAPQQSGAPASVTISPEARKLQRIAELARKGDEQRAAKVAAVKEQIDQGTYKVSADEVAKSIARAEVTRVLEEKK